MLTKRMAMRRMNEMWSRMALTLLFCGLLFHTCQGQYNSTDQLQVTTNQTSVMSQPGGTESYPKSSTDTSTTHALSSAAADMGSTIYAVITTQDTSARSQTTTKDADTEATTTSFILTGVDEKMDQSPKDQSENAFNSLGTRNEQTKDEKSKPDQTKVFVPMLVIGLIVAAALIGAYVWRNHCHRKTTGMKLAEETYMGDDADQGNTLVSVAPLNPPESQEKPSQNGEFLEAVKTQNPPAATNGHSTTKADTEL